MNDNGCYNRNNLINKTFNVDELKKPAVSVGFFLFFVHKALSVEFIRFRKVSAGKSLF